ncbi:hypothetical protein OBBRIDRAFT_742845, partial [Obba rivulosa]
IFVADDMAFRVYQGVLSRYSPVFSDLFTLPKPEEAEIMDGCAVVRSPDNPAELERLLHVLSGETR